MTSILTKNQKRAYRTEYFDGNENPCVLIATVRYDDQCGNGHNSFAITGDLYEQYPQRGEPTTIFGQGHRKLWLNAGGCLHELIAERFPNLAPLIKWHGTTSEGPLWYVENTVYLAGERDHWGLLKGEASASPKHQETRIRFGNSPMTHKLGNSFAAWLREAVKDPAQPFKIVAVEHKDRPGEAYKFGPKFTYEGFPREWHTCPFDDIREAEELTAALSKGHEFLTYPTLFGEGKARELDAARRAAVWLDATDAELSAPATELKAKLEARLPALMAEFRAAVESLGFTY